VPADHAALGQLRIIAKRLADTHDFLLAEDGFPKKGGAMTAADAIEIIAADGDADAPIAELHDLLRGHDIWLWRRGAIEAHFGIDGKTEGSRTRFIGRLREEKPDEPPRVSWRLG
jgi:hypothetical protein